MHSLVMHGTLSSLRCPGGLCTCTIPVRLHTTLCAGVSSGNDASTPTGSDMERYNVPHLPFLTPPHMRKGKGGRQPAADPRLVSGVGTC